MKIIDETLLAAVVQLLSERLPTGWAVERWSSATPAAVVSFSAPNQARGEVPAAVCQRLDPRGIATLPDGRPLLVVAPYLSRGVRELLERKAISYVDLTGNLRVVVDRPGLFMSAAGADVNPAPDKREFKLRGTKAGRVVCKLATSATPLGVRELAAAVATDPGYVSRLLATLDAEGIVDRSRRGQVERVDWRKLLQRWAEDSPLESRATLSTWIDPRGLDHAATTLRTANLPVAVTGSAAAASLAPVAPTRLLSVYVGDMQRVVTALGLRPAETGANVILLQPEDEGVLIEAESRQGMRWAPLPVVVADLLSGHGRSPAEADALIAWMAEHQEAWHG